MLLAQARLRQVERLNKSRKNILYKVELHPLEPKDFDPDYNRSSRAYRNRNEIFNGLVGFEKTSKQFRGYQRMVDSMRRFDIDLRGHVPWVFVFKGPPGTGKT